MIYLNNAATSFPKPPDVIAAVHSSLSTLPSEPGRSSGGDDTVSELRQGLARFFHMRHPERVALLPSATYALNLAILGLVEPESHVVTTVYEHNSVLRPLHHLSGARGIEISILTAEECRAENIISSLKRVIRPATSCVVMSHMSNVTGTVLPVTKVAALLSGMEIPLVVDGAQAAGSVAVDYGAMPENVYYCFAGHKALQGPAGTGGILLPNDRLPLHVFGGTGVHSSLMEHPGSLPLRHEAGTPNLSGYAGLAAGLDFVSERGIAALGAHRDELARRFISRVKSLPGLNLVPNHSEDYSAGIVSFYVDGVNPQELSLILSESFHIHTRSGLHCAPLVNSGFTLPPRGTVRISVGPYSTLEDIESAVYALTVATKIL